MPAHAQSGNVFVDYMQAKVLRYGVMVHRLHGTSSIVSLCSNALRGETRWCGVVFALKECGDFNSVAHEDDLQTPEQSDELEKSAP